MVATRISVAVLVLGLFAAAPGWAEAGFTVTQLSASTSGYAETLPGTTQVADSSGKADLNILTVNLAAGTDSADGSTASFEATQTHFVPSAGESLTVATNITTLVVPKDLGVSHALAVAIFAVDLELVAGQMFTLSGSSARAYINLYDPDGNNVFQGRDFGDTGSFSTTGLITKSGTYQIYASALVDTESFRPETGSASYSFEFAVVSTPAPAGLVLVGSALLPWGALVGWRWKRARTTGASN